MIADKALVVFSGGQDSTTCLFWAKKHFKEVVAVGFDYGQRHRNELDAARSIADTANVPYQVMTLPLLNEITDNSLTRSDIAVETQTQENELPNTFVEGRNLLFLSYAAIVAKGKGISHIIAGMGQTDFSGYPDCRDVFVKSLNVTLSLAMDYQFVIHTPLMFKNKAETWAMADELNVLDLVRNATVTCYNAIPAEGCGECPACKLRNEGLAIYLKSK
jgi:7-cyano-7-deazaguanine synthase